LTRRGFPSSSFENKQTYGEKVLPPRHTKINKKMTRREKPLLVV
jgi:hypothetical protein